MNPERETLVARAAELKLDHAKSISTVKLEALVKEAETNNGGNTRSETQMVKVVGPENGRWRASRRFTSEPQEIPLDDLTEDQLEALQGDPKLLVSIL